MPRYLHTMLRITDPERSRAFYEALGFTFGNEFDIVRDGEREATNYFYSLGDQQNVLELTYNHDGRTYELGTAYGHIAVGVDDLVERLRRPPEELAGLLAGDELEQELGVGAFSAPELDGHASTLPERLRCRARRRRGRVRGRRTPSRRSARRGRSPRTRARPAE